MKKHAALLLAVALAGSMFLASCSGDGSGASAPESSGGTESQSASAEESSGAETPELSGELVVMTLAGEPFVPAWQDQAAVFTEPVSYTHLASPRRREIFTMLGLDFTVQAADIAEACLLYTSRRAVYVTLTEKGQGVREESMKIVREAVNRIIRQMGDQAADRLIDALQDLSLIHILELGRLKQALPPKEMAAALLEEQAPLSKALPTPAKIAWALGRRADLPLTMKEGRGFLAALPPSGHKLEKANPPEPGEKILEAKNLFFRYDKDCLLYTSCDS